MKALIHALKIERHLQLCVLACDRYSHRNIEKHAELVEVALRADNAKWKGRFEFNSTTMSLTLSGPSLRNIDAQYGCIIRSLNPLSLVLERTGFDLNNLSGLLLHSLRVVGQDIDNVKFFNDLPLLKTLELQGGKLSLEARERILKSPVKLIEIK
ncbi:MAG: hypothetical protein HQL32_12550, partial [Planctomycetes bacterium]|nr:hypothetical protein [Planctomycetota bacterium]